MSAVYQYLIGLANGRFFIHETTTEDATTAIMECDMIYEYVQHNFPCRLLNRLDTTYDTNYHVKDYMQKYGIDNVRGGSFTENELPDYVVKALQYEFSKDDRESAHELKFLQNILTKSGSNARLANIHSSFDEYRRLRGEYKKYAIMDDSWLFDVEWMRHYIMNVHLIAGKLAPETAKIYRHVIGRWKWLAERYHSIKNPEFILDSFFYHKLHLRFPVEQKELNRANDLLDKVEVIIEVEIDKKHIAEQNLLLHG